MEVSNLENLITYYKEQKLAHAYLISTNNMQKCMQVLLKVIKNIFCVQEYQDNCNKCTLCHLIDLNNLPSLKIISNDGLFIKKEQILELKHFFSKDSQYTKESIYIIKNAEKMNKEAANTMLKFLEEPEGNIIGFFITNDKDNILLTIKSRCQIIDLNFTNKDYENYNIDEETYNEYLDILNTYLSNIELNKSGIIANELINIKEKDEIKILLQIALSLYNNLYNSRFQQGISLNKDFSFLNKLSNNNLKKKQNLLVEILKEIQYNVNLNMLLDKFVIEMEAINNETV